MRTSSLLDLLQQFLFLQVKSVIFVSDLSCYPFIPVYDVLQNGLIFSSMKLAGIIIICCGFILVLTPSNWADIVRSIIR